MKPLRILTSLLFAFAASPAFAGETCEVMRKINGVLTSVQVPCSQVKRPTTPEQEAALQSQQDEVAAKKRLCGNDFEALRVGMLLARFEQCTEVPIYVTDTLINPATGDYLADTARTGEWARDPANGLMNAAYLRLMTPLGSWFADVTLGSRLHELVREKDLARVERLAQQYAVTALQPLLTDGRAKSIDVSTVRPGNGRLLLAIELVDARGVSSAFELPVKVV